MPFCASCGSQVDGAFCPKCGAPVGAGAPPPGAAAPPPGAGAPPPVAAPMADNVAGALCYVLGFITGIIFLVLEPYSRNKAIRFHAFQAIFLSVSFIIIRIVLGIVFGIAFQSLGFFFFYATFWSLFWLLYLIVWLYMLYQTYQGKTVVLPIIGPMARQQA